MEWDFGGGANPRPGRFVIDVSYPERAAAAVPEDHRLVHDLRLPISSYYRETSTGGSFFHGPEHYSRYEIGAVLRNIHYVLIAGSELEIRCPDMDYWARRWLEVGSNMHTQGCIFGSHENEWQIHKNGINFAYLETLLREAEFRNIERVCPAGEVELYPNDWRHPESGSDPNKQFDLHVTCRK